MGNLSAAVWLQSDDDKEHFVHRSSGNRFVNRWVAGKLELTELFSLIPDTWKFQQSIIKCCHGRGIPPMSSLGLRAAAHPLGPDGFTQPRWPRSFRYGAVSLWCGDMMWSCCCHDKLMCSLIMRRSIAFPMTFKFAEAIDLGHDDNLCNGYHLFSWITRSECQTKSKIFLNLKLE